MNNLQTFITRPHQAAEALAAILEQKQRLVIVMHQRPDGDAMGAALALARLCKAYEQEVHVVSPTPYPHFLAWLPGRRGVIVAEQAQERAEEVIMSADVVFCVDTSSLRQLGILADQLQAASAKKVMIDHHRNPENFGDVLISDPSLASTTMVLYELICAMGQEKLIDKKMATALYVGLVTDTGNFLHANTNSYVHRVAAALLDKGVDVEHVSQGLYGHQTLNKLRFLGHALSNRLVVLEQWQTAYFFITGEDAKNFHLQAGDTAGLVQYALNLQGISFAALLAEQQDLGEVRLSFRSIGDLAVHDLAKEYFQGGGHKNAAGGVSKLSLQETIEQFEKMVRQEL